MPLSFEKHLVNTPAAAGHTLDVTVVFTSLEATLPALRQAALMAGQLSARIILVIPEIVPYPLPLSSPPVLRDFNERRFHRLACESPLPTVARVYLCRDAAVTLPQVLSAGSLIVIGSRRRWWPTPEERLARHLRKAGHEVIVTHPE